MKKFLAILLGALFVLSFAASAFAIHAEIPEGTTAVAAKGETKIELGGLLRTRAWMFDNLKFTEPSGGFISRGDVVLKGQKTKTASYYDQRARIKVQATHGDVTGMIELQGDQVWGYDGPNKKGDAMKWIQAWTQYKNSSMAGFPIGLKVGHMPLALGEQVFFKHITNGDDAIVFFMDPTKQIHVGLLTIKLSEKDTIDNNTDIDAYVGLMTFKLNDKNTIGANYVYLNQSDSRLKFQNLMVHANGSAAGFGYKGEADIQFGKAGEGAGKTKFKGYALMLGGNYKLDPVNIRASFGYGSGDNKADKNNKEFQAFMSDDPNYTLAYEYRVTTSATNQILGNRNQSSVANTTYYNLGVDFNATKDLKAKLDGFILRASKTPSGVSKNIGWEVDAGIGFNVAKNLLYTLDLGYLNAGDYYEEFAGGKDAKAVTMVRQQLIFSF